MSHRNARTTYQGRLLIVERHRAGWPQAHIAKAMGISRRCVAKWIGRFAAEGEAGLVDRSSRPRTCPRRTSPQLEASIIDLRNRERRGRDWVAAELNTAPRTVSRILARHGVPRLCDLDSITGEPLRASKRTTVRYERERPGELVHMDVKKLGRIPDGGGWRAEGQTTQNHRSRANKTRIGYDYVHSLVDDHSRLAYSEILPDEKGTTCAAFLDRAITYFADRDHPDRTTHHRQRLGLPPLAAHGLLRARHRPEVHQAPLPVAERQGRAPQPHPADRVGLPPGLHQQRPTSSRPCAMARALQHSTSPQLTRRTPANQSTVTNMSTGYS